MKQSKEEKDSMNRYSNSLLKENIKLRKTISELEQDQEVREHIDSVLPDEELKLCPFCGSKGIMENTKDGYYWVKCTGYCCQMFGKWSETEAIEIWNKRLSCT